MESKCKLLFNDYVCFFDKCNFRCDYCLNKLKPNETEIWKQTDQSVEEKHLFMRGRQLSYDSETKKMMDKTVDRFSEIIDTPILRISGGEILAIKDIEKFIEKYHEKYAVVQIVTNGFFLVPALIERFRKLNNIHIHLSLDGHTLEMNKKRVKSQEIQDRLLDNLEACVDSGLNIEIGSVLTNQNTKEFSTYLDYLMKYKNKITVLPSPVRGNDFVQYFPSKEDVLGFHRVLDNYDKYSSILPPKVYIRELIEFLERKKRGTACHIPRVAIQSVENGSITPCPNGWTLQLGNVNAENYEEITYKIGSESIYDILLQKRPRLNYCKECFTAYDIVNLYFNDQITIEELSQYPLYADSRVYNRLIEIKESMNK